jgi:release factor glutamine methyltransferase
VELRQGSWWEPLIDSAGTLNLVVSNPPYIPTAVWAELEAGVRDHEPSLALDGGGDGLDAIRSIAAGAKSHLAPGGWLLLEHHHDQSPADCGWLRAGAGASRSRRGVAVRQRAAPRRYTLKQRITPP